MNTLAFDVKLTTTVSGILYWDATEDFDSLSPRDKVAKIRKLFSCNELTDDDLINRIYSGDLKITLL